MSDNITEFKLQHIVVAVRDVNTEWHGLGLQLGLPEHILKPVGSHPDVEDRLRVMLSKWLDYDPQASWDKLAKALTAMGKNAIAANINVGAVSETQIAGKLPASDQEDTKARQEMTQTVMRKIKRQFASLQIEVRSAMEARHVKVSDVHQFLVSFFQSECCIPEAPDLTKLFNIVTEAKLWRYDHYGPLEELAETFLPDDQNPARKLVSKYKDQFSGFFVATKIVDVVDLSEMNDSEDSSDADSDDKAQRSLSRKEYKKLYRELKLKLRLDRTIKFSDITMSYIDTLWKALIKEFNLPPLTAIIKKIVPGSLIISWLVPLQVSTVIAASYFKALSFYQQHNIVQVQLDGRTLYHEEWIAGDINTDLIEACEWGQVERATVLLEYGADVNSQNVSGETALNLACCGGNSECVDLLLKAGAKTDIQEESGRTALYWAARFGYVNIVQMMVNHGAAVDLGRNEHGYTGLMWASRCGYTEIVSVLLEAKADPNITDEDGDTALHDAASNDCAEGIPLLVRHGAALDIRDKAGETALHKAAVRGCVAAVKTLVECGASVDIRNTEGLTALEVARGRGEEAVCEILQQHTKQETELTEEQRESIYQRLLKMLERTFLKEQVKKREEQQKKEHHHQREERVRGEREKRPLWNRLRGRRDRPGQLQIIGTAPAPEK